MRLCTCSRLRVLGDAPLYLFDGEVVDQVVVVFVEAAVQRHTVRVEEQILSRRERGAVKSQSQPCNVEPSPEDVYVFTVAAAEHKVAALPLPHTQRSQRHCNKYVFVTVDCGESVFVSKEKWRQRICFPVKRGFRLNPFKCCAGYELLLAK